MQSPPPWKALEGWGAAGGGEGSWVREEGGEGCKWGLGLRLHFLLIKAGRRTSHPEPVHVKFNPLWSIFASVQVS